MSSRRTRQQQALMKKSLALAVAAPQVVLHRTTRMALAGPVLSDRDRREFQRMVSEKTAAFAESWMAMWLACARLGFSMASAGFTFAPWSASQWTEKMASSALTIAAQGLAPVHRRATANWKRLGKIR